MPLSNFGIAGDLVWRCAQPDERGVRDFAALGGGVIIKLNIEELISEAAWCRAASSNVELRQRPIPTFTCADSMIVKLAAEIQSLVAKQRRVLVHCEHGRERTGLVVSAWLCRHQGWSLDAGLREMRAFGMAGIVEIYDEWAGLEVQLERVVGL